MHNNESNSRLASPPDTSALVVPAEMATDAVVSRFQRFTVARVHRSQINPAPYNPRIIDQHARKKLKDSIRSGEEGLIETLVWNKRTAILVSGHQRLSVLDELEGNLDYWLDVAVVDVPPNVEKRLNIKMNQLGLMGDFDLDPLQEILQEMAAAGEDLTKTGFDQIDIAELFPTLDTKKLFGDDKEPASVKADAATIEQMKATKKESYQKGKQQEDAGFMVHLVFGDGEEKRRFLERTGQVPEDDYIDGRALAAAVGVDLDKGA